MFLVFHPVQDQVFHIPLVPLAVCLQVCRFRFHLVNHQVTYQIQNLAYLHPPYRQWYRVQLLVHHFQRCLAYSGIKLGRKSIKGKTKKVFSHGSSKAIDHISTNQLFPKVLNDKEESASSGTKCIDFDELLERKNNDPKWVEVENVEKKCNDSVIDAVSRTELGLQAIPSCLQSTVCKSVQIETPSQSSLTNTATKPFDSNNYDSKIKCFNCNGVKDQDPHRIQTNRKSSVGNLPSLRNYRVFIPVLL